MSCVTLTDWHYSVLNCEYFDMIIFSASTSGVSLLVYDHIFYKRNTTILTSRGYIIISEAIFFPTLLIVCLNLLVLRKICHFPTCVLHDSDYYHHFIWLMKMPFCLLLRVPFYHFLKLLYLLIRSTEKWRRKVLPFTHTYINNLKKQKKEEKT